MQFGLRLWMALEPRPRLEKVMSNRQLGLVVSGDKVVAVDAEVPDTGPLEIRADLSWPLQSGDRATAYSTMYKQVSQYVSEEKIEAVIVKESAVSLGGTKKAHLESAELRGVVIAAAAAFTDVLTIPKARISKTFGNRKVDEYVKDDSFWQNHVKGKLRGGSREAALLLLAHRGKG